jgi:hypothetical protein
VEHEAQIPSLALGRERGGKVKCLPKDHIVKIANGLKFRIGAKFLAFLFTSYEG